MTSLTTKQTAHILREVIQYLRVDLEANPQFTVANLATLMAVIEFDGATQPEISTVLGGVGEAGLSRQLRYLRGKRQGVVQSPLKPVVSLAPLESDNRLNTVSLTSEGQAFANDLARVFNRLLKQALKT